MHEIGHINVDAKFLEDDNDPAKSIGDLKWLPDSRQLSFEYNHMLYTFPVATR